MENMLNFNGIHEPLPRWLVE